VKRDAVMRESARGWRRFFLLRIASDRFGLLRINFGSSLFFHPRLGVEYFFTSDRLGWARMASEYLGQILSQEGNKGSEEFCRFFCSQQIMVFGDFF
jgi:hypothetical protein